jgi:acetyltransferase-like isoleucine patch superfamily enzyme
MSVIHDMLAVVVKRPFHIGKYLREAFLYTFNALFWWAMRGKNITIGRNLHTLTTTCFRAERPGARIEVGDHFVAYSDCILSAWGSGKIRIGDCCSVGSGARLHARSEIRIGSHVLISWDALLIDFDGHSTDPALRAQEMESTCARLFPSFVRRSGARRAASPQHFDARPIAIGDRVWIGARAVILKGVTIGEDSIIAAGAVVAADIPPGHVAAGNPAKAVKKIGKP